MSEVVEEAMKIIKKNGLRLTKQRVSLLDFLEKSVDRYVGIPMVDDAMRNQYPGISHDTIYRNLQEFKDLGLIEIKHGDNGLAVKLECDRHHHHHFICQNCGKVIEIHMPAMDMNFYQKQLPGAQITGHSFELYGICSECQQKLTRKS